MPSIYQFMYDNIVCFGLINVGVEVESGLILWYLVVQGSADPLLQ